MSDTRSQHEYNAEEDEEVWDDQEQQYHWDNNYDELAPVAARQH